MSKTVSYTCRRCNATYPWELSEADQATLAELGLNTLRPCVCPNCDGRIYEMTTHDHQICQNIAALPDLAYRRTLADWEHQRRVVRVSKTGKWSTTQLRTMSFYEQLINTAKRYRAGVQEPNHLRENT